MLWACLAFASLSAHAQTATNVPEKAPGVPADALAALALVLPGPETPFARAAEAVREGFLAAHAIARLPLAIQVIEIDESAAQAIGAVQAARERGVRIVVGPLTRGAVNSVVERGDAGVPILLLNVPDAPTAVAASQLAFGLTIEDEATMLVRASLREVDAGVTPATSRRHVVVSGDSALARRTAAAYLAALRATTDPVITLDYAQHGAAGVAREIAKNPVTSIFLALDVGDAVQVRTRLPIDAPLFATSQVNAATGTAIVANDLEGVRFLDMPWLIESERPSVKRYRRAAANYNPEMQRLYALGIDAYRIASEWLAGRTRFEIDGVTGWLRVDRERGPRVERTPGFAVFREGRVERSDVLREVAR